MLRKEDFPKTLPGFSQFNLFWEYKNQSITEKIVPGEYFVSTQNEAIAKVKAAARARVRG